MEKITVNFTDPFGAGSCVLNVDVETNLNELTNMLADELGFKHSEDRLVGGLFKRRPKIPVVYDPKSGVLKGEWPISHFETIKNNSTLSYYNFPTNELSLNEIWLENNARLGIVSVAVTVDWAGNVYPVILPAQTSQDEMPLVQYIFAQIAAISGLQALPRGWQNSQWQLLKTRTGELIDGSFLGNIAEKINHGDFLRLSIKPRDQQEGIVILDEKNEPDPDELEIKIGDDLLDSIIIEQAEPVKVNDCLIELLQGDLTLQEVDAIVNAAKPTLSGGAGVDGAIHNVAGAALVKASEILAPCSPGKAVLTPGFSLPAKWVIHTVGPIYKDGEQGEEKTLANAYRSSLGIAFFSGFSTIAFPAISTGAYGYPLDQAAKVTWKTILDYLQEKKESSLKILRIVVQDDSTYDVYAKYLNQI